MALAIVSRETLVRYLFLLCPLARLALEQTVSVCRTLSPRLPIYRPMLDPIQRPSKPLLDPIHFSRLLSLCHCHVHVAPPLAMLAVAPVGRYPASARLLSSYCW